MHSFRHDGQEAVDYFTQAIDNKHFPLKTPTIFIAGDQDPETENFQERYQEWATFSRQVSLKVVNGGGHYFLKHQAAELAQIIVDSMPVGRQSEAHART